MATSLDSVVQFNNIIVEVEEHVAGGEDDTVIVDEAVISIKQLKLKVSVT